LEPVFDARAAAIPLREALLGARRVTALCHENPDGDTLGGAAAMALIAQRLGKESEVVSADLPAPAFDFVPGLGDVRSRPSPQSDVAVICDAATLERVGAVARECATWLSSVTLVNIDHHVTNSYFGTINCVDPAAAATCEVIAEMLPHLGVAPDREIATALLTGIVRDSHGFSGGATRPQTLRLAADLLEAGADLPGIHRRILAELPYPTMALWGRLLATSQAAAGGRVVHTTLTPEMLAATGTLQEDADGLVEFMANAKDADVTILFRALGPRQTRVSFRVMPPVDATRLAAPFGGGGHSLRAGCTVEADSSEAVPRVLAVCEAVLADPVPGAGDAGASQS
jgi:bifunctional oligoribonuclease and PAP phosphatase NrnA